MCVDVMFVVVVYSTHPSVSNTLSSLAKINFDTYDIAPKFYIWDNSKSGFGLDSIPLPTDKTIYRHTGENVRLSDVYNRAITDSEDADYYILLDDDSTLTDRYFSAVHDFMVSRSEQKVDRSSAVVAVPKIMNANTLISPGLHAGVRGKKLSHVETGEIDSSGVVAMMSGTVISKFALCSGLRFDPRLNFYGVDTRFFIDYQKTFGRIFILDCILEHKSALRDINISIEEQIRRFSNLLVSRYLVFDYLPFCTIRVIFFCLLFSCKKAIERRSFRYLYLIRCCSYKYWNVNNE